MNGNGIVDRDLPYQRHSELETEQCIRGLVRLALASRTKQLPSKIGADTAVPVALEEEILEEVGYNIDRLIPKRRKTRHGLKVSTLVGYIYSQQASFARRQ